MLPSEPAASRGRVETRYAGHDFVPDPVALHFLAIVNVGTRHSAPHRFAEHENDPGQGIEVFLEVGQEIAAGIRPHRRRRPRGRTLAGAF